MTEQQIKDTLKLGERITLECKKAKNEVPKSVWETYSAFANTIGGNILLGIEENRNETNPAKRFVITGVENPQKIISDLWNTVNSNKVNQNILNNDDVEIVDVDGKHVVYINVPQADWRIKPVFLNENIYKGTFKRNHEGDYHCKEDEIKAMIRDANENGNDGILIEYYGMDDIDEESLRQYRTEFRVLNNAHVWNKEDNQNFLTKLGGYTKDRRTGKEGLTLAGLLMFGKGLSVRERFANFRMDYLDMSHLVGDERYHDRLTYDGRWENNLYQFYHRVMPKLTFDLPHPFQMEGIQRVDDTPQHKAVREAFTNAIIHSDVFLPGAILRIEKHDDRLCLRNPGTLKLPIDLIYKGGNSKARNPRIQTMLRMIGYGENIGSGFPMIIDAWKQAGYKEPTLDNKLDIDEVELILYLQSKQALNKSSQVAQTIAQTTAQTIAQTTVEKVFQLIKENPSITKKQLVDIIGKSARTIQYSIEKLKTENRIRRVGSATYGGHWEINDISGK